MFLPFHTCLSFVMLEYVSFLCSIYLQSIHTNVLPQAQQSDSPTHFSSLAIAKFADCMTCLALQMFLFWFRQTIEFFPVYFCLVWICLNMFPSYISFLCNLSIPVCSHRLSRANTGCNPKGFPPLSWWSREIQVPICL